METDVLIVGAGPAGTTAAMFAERLGFRALLVERERMPRDKVCGDVIVRETSSSLLQRLGLDLGEMARHYPHQILSGFLAQLPIGEALPLDLECLSMRRLHFDEMLWSQVAAENRLDDAWLLAVERLGPEKYVSTCRVNGKERRIISRYIIAADGCASKIRRAFFPESKKWQVRIATRYYMAMESPQPARAIISFDRDVAPGYFWCFQVGEALFNTGVYLAAEVKGSKPYELHRHYLRTLFGHELEKAEFRSWPIPANTNFSELVEGNIILTGDAAGLCDMALGHGIDNAMISGCLAVEAIVDSRRRDVPYPLREIYRFKLTQWLGNQMRASEQLLHEISCDPACVSVKMAEFFSVK